MTSSTGVSRNDSSNDIGLTSVGLLAAVATRDEQFHLEGMNFELQIIASNAVG